MKNLKTTMMLCLIGTSLSVQADYYYDLQKAFYAGKNLSLDELKQDLSKNRTCVASTSTGNLEDVLVMVAEYIIPGRGPLFPEEKFEKILGPIEQKMNLSPTDARASLVQSNTETGFVSKYDYRETQTEYRKYNDTVVFFSTQSWKETEWEYGCDILISNCNSWEETYNTRMYGYCY